ncbi:MAG TPA: outer membrane beta-barrel protein [Gemmatirosa sp.]
MSRIATLAIACFPAALAAQPASPPAIAPSPYTADDSTARSATRSATSATPSSAATATTPPDSVRGFEPGRKFFDVRTSLGVEGTASIGVHGEFARSRSDFGTGTIGLGGGVDYYHYGARYAGLGEWSVSVLPISGYANYHFPIRNRRFDPYVGAGLGYEIVKVSAQTSDGSVDYGGTQGSSVFLVAHAGARYFLRPNLALQAETGFGVSPFSIGVVWKP